MKLDRDSNDPSLLTCWKDIARYLGKGVRTVQRWEREFDLPVRRPKGIHHKSSVIANTRDLDAWLDSHWSGRNGKYRNERANTGDNLTRAEDLIQKSQHLRAAHAILLEETALALDELVQNCSDLKEIKKPIAAPPADFFPLI